MQQLPDDHDDLSQTIREAERVIYGKLGKDDKRLARFTGLRLDWKRYRLHLHFELC